MLGSGLNLVTTVIGFGMSAAFIVFICARLICGRNRSSDSQSGSFEIQLRSDQGLRDHVIHGVEPVVVAAIPMMQYCREAFLKGRCPMFDMLRGIPRQRDASSNADLSS